MSGRESDAPDTSYPWGDDPAAEGRRRRDHSSISGRGRLADALAAIVLLGLAAALAAYAVSDLCFHNLVGVEIAASESDRGPWCEAIAPGSGWEAPKVALAAAIGGVVALLPGPIAIRIGLYALLLAGLIAVPLYMATLGYSVGI